MRNLTMAALAAAIFTLPLLLAPPTHDTQVFSYQSSAYLA